MNGCWLHTARYPYHTTKSFAFVCYLMQTGRLIPVTDDNGVKIWLNPSAVVTVVEATE